MINWLVKNWSKATIFLAAYMLIFLLMYVKDYNYALFLIWLQTPVYYLHQFEEYIFPSGFEKFFNRKVLKSNEDEFPLTPEGCFWINVPLTFVTFPLSAVLSHYFDLSIGIWTAWFSIVNSLSHVVMFFVFKNKYNPGLIASVLLNIPIGIYTVWYFAQHQIVSANAQILGFVIGVLGQALLMFWGFKILRPKIKAS